MFDIISRALGDSHAREAHVLGKRYVLRIELEALVSAVGGGPRVFVLLDRVHGLAALALFEVNVEGRLGSYELMVDFVLVLRPGYVLLGKGLSLEDRHFVVSAAKKENTFNYDDDSDLPFVRAHELDPFEDGLVLAFVGVVGSWPGLPLALLRQLGEKCYLGLFVELSIIVPPVVGPLDHFRVLARVWNRFGVIHDGVDVGLALFGVLLWIFEDVAHAQRLLRMRVFGHAIALDGEF